MFTSHPRSIQSYETDDLRVAVDYQYYRPNRRQTQTQTRTRRTRRHGDASLIARLHQDSVEIACESAELYLVPMSTFASPTVSYLLRAGSSHWIVIGLHRFRVILENYRQTGNDQPHGHICQDQRCWISEVALLEFSTPGAR